MNIKDFPQYFIIILAIYAASLIMLLSTLGSVALMVDFLPFLLLLLLPAILTGVYIYRFPKLWMRIIIIILSGIAILLSIIILMSVM